MALGPQLPTNIVANSGTEDMNGLVAAARADVV